MYLFTPSTTSHLAIVTQLFWLVVLLLRAMKRSTTASDAPVDKRFLHFLLAMIGVELVILAISANTLNRSQSLRPYLPVALIVMLGFAALFYDEISKSYDFNTAAGYLLNKGVYGSALIVAIAFAVNRFTPFLPPLSSKAPYVLVAIVYIWLLVTIFRYMTHSTAVNNLRIGKMLRSFLMYSLLPLVTLLLLLPGFTTIWTLILIDVALFFMVFGITITYFNYQHYVVSLENRIVGTGVTLFLMLINSFGWVLSLVYLRQQLRQQLPLDDLFRANPALVLGFNPRIEALAMRIEVSNMLVPIGVFTVIGSAILFFALRSFYSDVVTRPVDAILKGIKAVEAGDYAANVALHQNDEIGQIAVSFNQMTDQLSATTTELKQYQSHLEELVDARTKDLLDETETRMTLEMEQAIQKAVAEERSRLEHETHDGLLQRLAGAKLRMAHWHRLLNTAHEQMHSELDLLDEQLTLGTSEIRQLMNGMPVPKLENELASLMPNLVSSARSSYGLNVHTTLDIDETRLKTGFVQEIFRIFQEGVSHSGRQGLAKTLWLSAVTADDNERIHIEIRDDGAAVEKTSPALEDGVNLNNMRVRVESLNGKLNITNEAEVGTTLSLMLPYPEMF